MSPSPSVAVILRWLTLVAQEELAEFNVNQIASPIVPSKPQQYLFENKVHMQAETKAKM